MSITIRSAGPADREACARLLTAQLVENHLPADPAGIAAGVDLALAPQSPAWLLLAERDGAPVGIVLANQIVSVEQCGYTLWVEELYVVPEARRRGVATAFLDYFERKAGGAGCAPSNWRSCPLRPPPSRSTAAAGSRTCIASG